MSAPFFLGKIIDVIYTNPSADYSSSLTRLCLALGGVFLCGAAANAVRVYLMQTSGATTHLLGHMGWGLGGGGSRGFPVLRPPCCPLFLHRMGDRANTGLGIVVDHVLCAQPASPVNWSAVACVPSGGLSEAAAEAGPCPALCHPCRRSRAIVVGVTVRPAS